VQLADIVDNLYDIIFTEGVWVTFCSMKSCLISSVTAFIEMLLFFWNSRWTFYVNVLFLFTGAPNGSNCDDRSAGMYAMNAAAVIAWCFVIGQLIYFWLPLKSQKVLSTFLDDWANCNFKFWEIVYKNIRSAFPQFQEVWLVSLVNSVYTKCYVNCTYFSLYFFCIVLFLKVIWCELSVRFFWSWAFSITQYFFYDLFKILQDQ